MIHKLIFYAALILCLGMPVDIDECDVENGGCFQICTDSEGSFDCSCETGFILKQNGADCLGELFVIWACYRDSCCCGIA